MKSLSPPLSPEEAKAYPLHKQGKTLQEISDTLGKKKHTIENQLSSARAKIKACANRCQECEAECPRSLNNAGD